MAEAASAQPAKTQAALDEVSKAIEEFLKRGDVGEIRIAFRNHELCRVTVERTAYFSERK